MNELKTWSDLSSRYSMVLFNNAPSINDGDVLQEWLECHECDAKDAQYHLETCEVKDCKECAKIKEEYGECPECECEPYQWYAIDISELDVEYLNKDFKLDIFYSETLGLYLLPVYHFGTSWNIMKLDGSYATETN